MDLSETRTDEHLAKDGVWVPLDGETKLCIAQWLNHNHRQYLQKALDPYKRALATKTMKDDVMEDLEIIGIAKCVLLGWEGLTDNGKPVEYSEGAAIKYLGDPTLRWFRDFVTEQAQDISNFRAAVAEEAIEAVGKPLSGGSIGVKEVKAS